MNINVGDYVRTIEGYICKILEIHEEYDDEYLDWNDIHSASIRKSHIIKSSPNIIDLIEEGDILSFEDGSICRVTEIEEDYYLLKDYGGLTYWERRVWLEDLMSIVTHEQMEAMEYKIERL